MLAGDDDDGFDGNPLPVYVRHIMWICGMMRPFHLKAIA